jgi:hypothetical protein
MGLEQAKTSEIVAKAVDHKWGVPEFQRAFVWSPQKVRDLVDSLWRGYPVGSFLVWYADEYAQPKAVEDHQIPDAWIVDGQQRTTAFALLLGRRPYWWEGDWNKTLDRHDVRFNVLTTEEPFFSLRTAAMKGAAATKWVSVREVLSADDDELSALIQNLLVDLDLPGGKFGTLWTRLDSVRKVRDTLIPVMTVMMDLEDVTEIFGRLNSAGTKVTEADIALALAASQNPGWAREEFLPFLHDLKDAGFDIDPNLVFRSCVAIGLGRARLKEVPATYWKSQQLPDAWAKTKAAWRAVIQYIEGKGILSAEVLPTKNALIPLTYLTNRFADALTGPGPFAWFLHATRANRYSGSAITTLDADVKTIQGASDSISALHALHAKLPEWNVFAPDDFMQDYRDRFLRLMLYLVMYERHARDWISKQRLGFIGSELLERFNPHWHHIFPRAYLRNKNVQEDLWNAFANIAVIAPTTNVRFGAKSPPSYLERFGIDLSLLGEQLVPTESRLLTAEGYEEFLKMRALALAEAANQYFSRLNGSAD